MPKICLLTFLFASIAHATVPDIDGQWSPWSSLETPCVDRVDASKLVECNGGVRKRYRSCTNPKPEGGGLPCDGYDEELFPCNEHKCQLPGDLLWSPWGECSASCGRGEKKRYTMCGTIREKVVGLNRASGTTTIVATTATTTETTTTGTETTTTGTETTTTGTGTTTAPSQSGSSGQGTAPSSSSGSPEDQLAEIELEYEEACQANQYNETTVPCNTWNREHCPSSCVGVTCPPFAKCLDTSTEEDPKSTCVCQLGTIMKDDNSSCIAPPPTRPTPRPIPTMPPEQKAVSNVITKSASTIIIIFLSITLGLFFLFGIFDPSRIIHMNMEIALLLAHICLLPTLYGSEEKYEACRIVSILTNFFFLACFMFMLLESVYVYSIVAWVVKKDGLFTPVQNVVVGWGTAFVIILSDMCFHYDNFGGEYHCWLRLDSNLMYGIYIPMIMLVVMTFAVVEAAGSSDYTQLEGIDERQRTTAKIMQRTLLLILPLVFVSFVLGSWAEYQQNIYLYSLFTLCNGIVGGVVFFFHCTANATVRQAVVSFKNKLCPGKNTEGED